MRIIDTSSPNSVLQIEPSKFKPKHKRFLSFNLARTPLDPRITPKPVVNLKLLSSFASLELANSEASNAAEVLGYCEKLIEFSKTVIQTSSPYFARSLLEECSNQIGCILYLFQTCSDSLFYLDESDFTKTGIKVAGEMQEVFATLREKIRAVQTEQEKYGLQDGCRSAEIYASVEISKLLITKNGRINAHLIPLVFDELVKSSENFSFYYKAFAEKILLQLSSAAMSEEKSLKYQNYFSQLQAPQNLAARFRCEQAIRSMINFIPPDLNSVPRAEALLTSRDTAIAALTSLITINKGASFKHQAPRLHSIMDDVKDALEEGSLFRIVDDVRTEFPFTAYFCSKTIRKEVELDQYGNIQSDALQGLNAPIWNAPGMKGALEAMGIPNSHDLGHAVMKALFAKYPGDLESRTLEIRAVIDAYAEYWLMHNPQADLPRSPKELSFLGYNGYSRFTALATHQAINSSMEKMSNECAQQMNSIEEKINEIACPSLVQPASYVALASQALFSAASVIFRANAPSKESVDALIKSCVKETLTAFADYLWEMRPSEDPSFPSQMGVFQLYEKNGREHKRIDGPQAFSEFTINVLKKSQEAIIRAGAPASHAASEQLLARINELKSKKEKGV